MKRELTNIKWVYILVLSFSFYINSIKWRECQLKYWPKPEVHPIQCLRFGSLGKCYIDCLAIFNRVLRATEYLIKRIFVLITFINWFALGEAQLIRSVDLWLCALSLSVSPSHYSRSPFHASLMTYKQCVQRPNSIVPLNWMFFSNPILQLHYYWVNLSQDIYLCSITALKYTASTVQ